MNNKKMTGKYKPTDIPVGLYWDIENCQVPKGMEAGLAAQIIREQFVTAGYREVEFMVACDINKQSPKVIQELVNANVNVVYVLATSKNAADEKLKQAIRRFPTIYNNPAALIVITGDINFSGDLSDLKHRYKLHITLLCKENSSQALLMCADETYIFREIITSVSSRNPDKTLQQSPISLKPIGVFLDIKSFSIFDNTSATILTNDIRNKFFTNYKEVAFTAVCDFDGINKQVIQELNDSQVNLVHVPATLHKNAVNEKLKKLIRCFGDTYCSQGTILLMSNDADFIADLNDLRYNSNIHVILLHDGHTSNDLIRCANEDYNFMEILELSKRKLAEVFKCHELLIENLPKNKPEHLVKARLGQLSENCGGRVIAINGSTAIIRFNSFDSADKAQQRLNDELVFGFKITVTFSKNGVDIPANEQVELPYCTIHNKYRATIPLRNLEDCIHTLLNTHNGKIPLPSLANCLETVFKEPLTVNERSVPLECLVLCLSSVELRQGISGVKFIERANSEMRNDVNNNKPIMSPQIKAKLSCFRGQLVGLLKTKANCQLSFSDLFEKYRARFGRPLIASDYGFTKLIDLLDALKQTVQVMGDGDKRIVTVTHHEQIGRFTSDLLRILKSQARQPITVSELPSAYERVIGKKWNIVDYGVCETCDILIKVPKTAVIITTTNGETSLALPIREYKPQKNWRENWFN